MKLLVAILVLLGIAFAVTVALPLVLVGLPLFVFAFIWFLPILIILCSDRTTGGEKLAWILAIVFLSWFAWIFYFLLAPISGEPRYRDRYRYDSYRSNHRRNYRNDYRDDYRYY